MPEPSYRRLAHSPEDLRPLHRLCREGRLYDVERWITEGKPLQLTPEAIPKGTRPKTALQIALETGQHSLVTLLLQNGYQIELEQYAPLDLALRSRRWDLFDLLLEWGGDLKCVDTYTVLETYNADLYERFRAAGYDLTEGHAMADILGHSTSNRPLLGFVKRHRVEDPRIQQELNIALGHHARKGNEGGVTLCLWAGADPHAPAPNSEPLQRIRRSLSKFSNFNFRGDAELFFDIRRHPEGHCRWLDRHIRPPTTPGTYAAFVKSTGS